MRYFFTVLNKAFNLAEKGDDGIKKTEVIRFREWSAKGKGYLTAT